MKEMEKMKNIIGKLWALPTTLFFGLTAGVVGVCLAPRKVKIRLAHNAVCFYNHPFMRGQAVALTLGNVILFRGDSDRFGAVDVAEHERQHTLQAEVLGVFYVPLHLICLAVYGGDVRRNPLEHGPYADPPRPW